MEEKFKFTPSEKEQIIGIAKRLKKDIGNSLYIDDER